MHIWSRRMVASEARLADAQAWSSEAAEQMGRVVGRQVISRDIIFGEPVGTIVLSCRFNSVDDFLTHTSDISTDAHVRQVMDRSDGMFLEPAVDKFIEVTATNGVNSEPWNLVLGHAGAIEAGHSQWSRDVELCDRIHSLTGCPTIVGRSVFGSQARTIWAIGCERGALLDRSLAVLAEDPEYAGLLSAQNADGASVPRLILSRRTGSTVLAPG